MAWLIGVAVPTVVAVVAFLAYLSRRRRVAELVAQLDAGRVEVSKLEVSHARLEARQEAALREAERLGQVAHELKGELATAEQEKTRLDFELRQVALVASRVPLLEPKVEELAVARRDLARAQERIAELVPVASELELRNQYIETLQRELTYRDERVLALELRVDELSGQLAAQLARLAASRVDSAASLASPEVDDVPVIDLVEAERRS